MNKYKRQHGSGNTSKGIYWILFAGIVAIIIFKVVIFVRNVNEVHDAEVEDNKFSNPGSYIIVTDSSGKKDTQFILNDIMNYDPATDTIKKRP